MSSHSLQRGKTRQQYLYRQISERIRKEIEEGKLPPLSRLPSMDDLAKTHGVNKITVRKALGELRAEGLIYSVPAQGTFVADPLAPREKPAQTSMINVGLVGHVLRKESFGPYHLEIVAGMQTELSRQHAALVILPAGGLIKEDDYFRLVKRAHVDAVIYLGPIDDQVASMEREAAAVAYWKGRGIPAASIRRIAGDFSRESGTKAGEQLLRGKSMPTGIFCLNDEMAVGLLAALQASGRCRVPQDVSVIGFDDIFWAASSVPALTTVRLDKCLLGRLAAQRVMERLQEPSLPATYIRVEPQIMLRSSTGPGPAKIGPDVHRS
jgi:DNA-binding LacI/PurR family transcriptional regulator